MLIAHRYFISALSLFLLSINALAQDTGQQGPTLPTLPLMELIEEVEKNSDRRFLISGQAPARVVSGTIKIRDVDYDALLTILLNNGFGAVAAGEFTNIVPLPTIRMHSLPLLHADDSSIADLEWVTRIVQLENALAPQLVPIVRPLLIQAGHLAAVNQSNSIVIVERYGNAKRVAELIQALDQAASQAN